MGRGASNESTAILYGETGPRGEDLADLAGINLSAKQQVALQALRALADRVPSAPGFEAYDICETAEAFERGPEGWLQLNGCGAVLMSLETKGLVARSSGCFKGSAEMVIDSESGWVLTKRGANREPLSGPSCSAAQLSVVFARPFLWKVRREGQKFCQGI